jgi:hypothetical protein
MKLSDVVANSLHGQGKSKNEPDKKFCPIELEVGTEVEMEHVDSKEAAKEICKDHLHERPDYYTGMLAKGEADVKKIAEKILKKNGYSSLEDFAKNKDKEK